MKRREQGAKINDNESLLKILLTGVSKGPILGPLVTTAWNVSKYGVFSGLYFPVFGLNTDGDLLRKSPYSV